MLVLFLVGCSASHYRKSADKDAYRIVQQTEEQVLGKTNAFTIQTPYSDRKPEEIPPSELIDDRLQQGQKLLTIEEALKLAVDQSRRYQAAKEALYLRALALSGQRHVFGPRFFANSAGTFSRGSSGQKQGQVASEAGVNQVLKSGGRIGINLANDVLRYYSGDPKQSIISTLSVNITQPLLRGFGKNNPAVERLTQAERDVVYAVRDFAFFQDQFALEIVNEYFDLLGQKDIIRNRYTNYLGRVQSTQRLEARAKDRERSSEVDQARQAELTAKNNYINTVALYRNSLDVFKIKLGLAVGDRITLDDSVLEELNAAGLIPAPLEPQFAYRLALTNQLVLLNAIDSYEDAKRKVRVAANQLKPDLTVYGNASVPSDVDTDYTWFDPEKVRAGVGVSLELPLDRLLERNAYRASLIDFEVELRTFTLILDELYENLQRGLRTLEQRRQNYEIQKNALALANRRVASATLMLEAGRSEVRDLVEAQDAQISAQNALTAALVDYQRTRLQLLLDIGTLEADTPKFWLKDHLAAYLPSGTVPAAPADNQEETVLPPENYFN